MTPPIWSLTRGYARRAAPVWDAAQIVTCGRDAADHPQRDATDRVRTEASALCSGVVWAGRARGPSPGRG